MNESDDYTDEFADDTAEYSIDEFDEYIDEVTDELTAAAFPSAAERMKRDRNIIEDTYEMHPESICSKYNITAMQLELIALKHGRLLPYMAFCKSTGEYYWQKRRYTNDYF